MLAGVGDEPTPCRPSQPGSLHCSSDSRSPLSHGSRWRTDGHIAVRTGRCADAGCCCCCCRYRASRWNGQCWEVVHRWDDQCWTWSTQCHRHQPTRRTRTGLTYTSFSVVLCAEMWDEIFGGKNRKILRRFMEIIKTLLLWIFRTIFFCYFLKAAYDTQFT